MKGVIAFCRDDKVSLMLYTGTVTVQIVTLKKDLYPILLDHGTQFAVLDSLHGGDMALFSAFIDLALYSILSRSLPEVTAIHITLSAAFVLKNSNVFSWEKQNSVCSNSAGILTTPKTFVSLLAVSYTMSVAYPLQVIHVVSIFKHCDYYL
ncbi:unnamed protein product [Strongylus vulgaris]|uniref:Uncharacterized protein n=1 Tax=Strongylus vulgaris TaxID=40348 RepID=A0A3P7KAG7_STRVU|nr:unnamed protein product [Strongylus vulgaris]